MGLFGLRCMRFRQAGGWVGERGVAHAEATAERTCRNVGGICPQGGRIWLFRRAMPPGGTVLYLYAAKDEDG